jgi:diguanylate cyclase (GGDEF)-like protein
VYAKKRNKDLEYFNSTLKHAVLERTKELVDANEKLKIMSRYDSLTKVVNHRHFMELGATYFDIAKRNGSHLQVISLDLDFFKRVNDTYGHQAGDKVLVTFAESIKNILRKSDIFGRIGGEEFAICLQNTSIEGALLFSQRILSDIANLKISYGEHIICITVSIGIADLKDESSFEEVLRRSDEALYKAKRLGRNRVEVA